MNRETQLEDITIDNYKEIENPYGSGVKEKKQGLKPIIKTLKTDEWPEYFKDRKLSQQSKEEVESGDWYIKVAIDPDNKAMAGFLEVRRKSDNFLSLEVFKEYQGRGVAGALIREAQKDHDKLNTINFAGKEGEYLYLKMGFKNEGGMDHFVWKKEK
jgi:ribosomal protein S18 acetylase RimI-like enzyme